MADRPQARWQPVGVVAFLAVMVGVWQLVAWLGLLPAYSFPSPGAVATRLFELLRDGTLSASIQASLVRMVLGYLLSAALGIAIGLAMGSSPLVNRCLKSLFLGLQTLPSVAWVPIALLLFGLNDAAIYFVIVMSSSAAMAVATADGIAHIPPLYLRVARTFGASRWTTTTHVVLPAALPSIVTGVKLGWTLGWHGVVSAELVKSTVGLGFLLHMGRELNDAAQVVAVMLVTVLVGLLVDRLIFRGVERRIRHRWGLETGGN